MHVLIITVAPSAAIAVKTFETIYPQILHKTRPTRNVSFVANSFLLEIFLSCHNWQCVATIATLKTAPLLTVTTVNVVSSL